MKRPAVLLILVMLAAMLLPASAALAQAEKILDTETGWTYLYGANEAAIEQNIAAGFRPFTINRVAANQYDVVSVANSGPYAVSGFSAANMHYNKLSGQLANELAGRRIVSLDCFPVITQTRMTAITVPNPSGTVWGWVVGQTRQQVIDWIANSATPLRILDLSIYTVDGQKNYAAVAVANQGANFQNWWWYFDKTGAEIAELLQQNNARLLDIELETAPTVLTPARFACVMVAENPGAGWFFSSLTASGVQDMVAQTGGRLTNLLAYTNAFGTTQYAVSLVDNANPQTRRVRTYMANAEPAGTYGFKLKRVGGPVVAALNENFVFEPASSLKILHAAYAVHQAWQDGPGSIALTDSIWVPNTCGGDYWNNVCPDDQYNCNARNEQLTETIRIMMQASHNGRTRTIEELFGRSELNDFAEFAAGLNDTRINHTLGCLCGNPFNTTTASELGAFYEQIVDGTHFDSDSRDVLYTRMANVTAWGYGSTPDHAFYTLGQVIAQEAAATNLTAGEIADFRSQLRYATKGGGYGCSGVKWRSAGGWYSIPVKLNLFGNWVTVYRDYVVTTFVHGGYDPGAEIAYPAAEEILREQIREALQLWDEACATGIASHPADATVDQGQTAQFTITAGGTGHASYQWLRRTGDVFLPMSDIAGKFEGTTTSQLTILDAQPSDERLYRCRITKICGTSTSNSASLTVIPEGATNAPSALPTHLVMHAPSPNPFNPQVTLRFDLPRATDLVVLEVFDVAGRRVRSFLATSLPAGSNSFTWNGTDDGGRKMSSGMYLARLRAGGEQATHRLMLVE